MAVAKVDRLRRLQTQAEIAGSARSPLADQPRYQVLDEYPRNVGVRSDDRILLADTRYLQMGETTALTRLFLL